MSLSLNSRAVGSVTVFDCSGRLAEGPSIAALHQRVADALPVAPYFVLQMSGVEFIDSSGVGLLVRMLNQTRSAGGDLKLCALSPKVSEVLRVTRLASIFDRHDNDADAVVAFYRGTSSRPPVEGGGPVGILCVDPSSNVVAYIRELVRQTGERVLTTTNVPDAVVLARATRPKLLLINAGLRRSAAARPLLEVGPAAVLDIPDDFGAGEAAEMGHRLLGELRAALGGPWSDNAARPD